MGMGAKSKQGMADVFNRWWAQGATMPSDWSPFGVYFETIPLDVVPCMIYNR